MASAETLTRLKSELEAVRETIRKIQAGEFEVRRGDRYFGMPGVRDLRREERRLLRAIQRIERPGVRQGVPRGGYGRRGW